MDYDKEKKKTESYNQLRILQDEYIKVIRECLFDFNKEVNPPVYKIIYQNFLQRLYYSVQAANALLPLFNKDKNFKMPIALQLRTPLLDGITMVYLSQFVEPDNLAKFDEPYATLNHPLCRRWAKEIKGKPSLKKQEVEDLFKKAKSLFPLNFIEENGEIVLNQTIQVIKPENMVSSIKAGPLIDYSKAYTFYDWFSRYEHFTILSKLMLENDSEIDFNSFLEAFYYIYYASYLALKILEADSARINTMEDLCQKMSKIDGVE